MATPAPYPVQLFVEYPDRPLNRLTSFFRIFTVIPIAIVLSAVGGGGYANGNDNVWWSLGGVGGLLFFAPLLMIVFRQKYPRWWFDWNLQLLRFGNRVTAYLFLLRDEYPSTDDEQAVRILIPYPDARQDLNRWLPLVKWLMAIPHYIVLFVLFIVLLIVVIIAWFAILFTSRYPRGLFDFVVGVMRWAVRVEGYAFILVTDVYPPFRLGP
ncbi:MAG: DUF4389 domain-containing protein [Chloroflexi bacterium]|nr:DUF4389 domain-containing protein [Chloroflexota bacterium]